mgnify:CR=1 FL=1
MSLLLPVYRSIFVSVKQKKRKLKALRDIVVIVAFFAPAFMGTTPLAAQQLYPGDVTNNGVVDKIDVLYWSYVRGLSGPPRDIQSGDWAPIPLSDDELWGQTFPGTDIDYAYADCNGDGVINDADLAVVNLNYWLSHGEVVADQFGASDINNAQILDLQAVDPETSEGQEEIMTLGYGLFPDNIPSLHGMAFTLLYNGGIIAEDASDPNQSAIYFNYTSEGAWFAGSDGSQAEVFIYSNDELGIADVVLYQAVAGNGPTDFGMVGEFNIIMEEVIFGLEQQEDILIVEPQTLDNNFLTTGPVQGDGTTFFIMKSAITSLSDLLLGEEDLNVYPNPSTGGWITIELTTADAKTIKTVEVMDLSGKTIRSFQSDDKQAHINLEGLPLSAYLLRIKTDAGSCVQRIIKGTK